MTDEYPDNKDVKCVILNYEIGEVDLLIIPEDIQHIDAYLSGLGYPINDCYYMTTNELVINDYTANRRV